MITHSEVEMFLQRLAVHPGCDFLAEQLGLTFVQVYPRREIAEEAPIITGPLGIWTFPILNRLITRRRLRGRENG